MIFARASAWWRRASLKTRHSLLTSASIAVVVTGISGYFIARQRQAMLDTLQERAAGMREELTLNGIAVGTTAALASERALAVKDFLFVSQILQVTQKSDAAVVYADLENASGRVVLHTNPTLAGHASTPIPDTNCQNREARICALEYQGQPVLDVGVPLQVANQPWGTMHFGLSLKAVDSALTQQRAVIEGLTRQGILTTVLVSVVLLALGLLLDSFAVQALTRPLDKLVASAKQLQGGTFGAAVSVEGSPEFVNLAQAFNDMSVAVRRREGALQQALNEADAANRLKSEFLANISHELRTPLNSILNVPAALMEDFVSDRLWQCDTCKESFQPDDGGPEGDTAPCPECSGTLSAHMRVVFRGDPEIHRRLNSQALQSGKHLLSVVNDLLDFSKMEAGKMELVLESVNSNDLFFGLKSTMTGLLQTKNLRLIERLPAQGTELQADRVKLNQVFINLIGNAVKFTPEGGTVTITASPEQVGGQAFLHAIVSDTGIGIPQEKQGIIFEPFRQADSSHTRGYGGTGLGLAITRNIVDLHHGKIWVESQVGVGSAFHVMLPLRPAATTTEAPAPVKQVRFEPTNKPRVAVMVDDDPKYLELASRMMRDAGITVHMVNESSEAVERIVGVAPDFVMLDVMMPRISGLDVLRKLKEAEISKKIPVIVSTAFYSNEQLVRALGGVWLPKPWTSHELADCLLQSGIVSADAISVIEKRE